jgi:hypothetical protein
MQTITNVDSNATNISDRPEDLNDHKYKLIDSKHVASLLRQDLLISNLQILARTRPLVPFDGLDKLIDHKKEKSLPSPPHPAGHVSLFKNTFEAQNKEPRLNHNSFDA